MQQACAEGLIHHFDGVPPDCLEGFVTLRRKVIPGFRFVKCLRLLQAVPLGDGYTLGSRPLQCNNLSAASAQIATESALADSITGCPFALTEIRHSRSRTALDKIHLSLGRRKSENDRW